MKGIKEANELLIDAMLFLELLIEFDNEPIPGVNKEKLAWCAHACIQKAWIGFEITDPILGDMQRIMGIVKGDGPNLRIV